MHSHNDDTLTFLLHVHVDYFRTCVIHTCHFFSYPPSWIVGDLKIIREAMATIIKYGYISLQ